MENKIIWALFDDGAGSWHNLQTNNTIISIGINNNQWQNYYKINLNITNYELINELSKLPKPDIIVASPPCESWSIADNQQRLLRESTNNSIVFFNYDDVKKNNEIKPKTLRRNYFKQWATTLNGLGTCLSTINIIEYFKPKYYVIENPATSKIWEFIDNFKLLPGGYKNKAYYNAYNQNFTKKPTNFMCNIKLNLKLDNIKQNKLWSQVTTYDERSSIPKELLHDILEQITEHENGTIRAI